MAQRIVDPKRWEEKWFRLLTPNQKLLYVYFSDKCDLAGFIEIDYDRISFDTGLNRKEIEAAYKGLGRGLEGGTGANQWRWLTNFIEEQKNSPIDITNNAHKHILKCISNQKSRFDLSLIYERIGIDVEGGSKGVVTPPVTSSNVTYSKELHEKIIEKLLSDQIWCEERCMQFKLPNDNLKTLKEWLIKFEIDIRGRDNYKKTPKEFKEHFMNWMKKQKVNNIEPSSSDQIHYFDAN